MLDLGATTCTARQPACGDCPLGPNATNQCRWARTGKRGPDPAVGSAGVSKPQSRFHGSDRQGRGRILAHLTNTARPIARSQVPEISGWPDDPVRAAAVVETLIADGLLTTSPDGSVDLPDARLTRAMRHMSDFRSS
jgi:A/G-specific adenine glycosylase